MVVGGVGWGGGGKGIFSIKTLDSPSPVNLGVKTRQSELAQALLARATESTFSHINAPPKVAS